MSSTYFDFVNPNLSCDPSTYDSSSRSSSSSSFIELSPKRMMASLPKVSNPSTLRVFDKKNLRFILDPTLYSLDHGTTEADSFISPFGHKLPLAVSWFHIHRCPFELTAYPSPSKPYIQWLDRVVAEKGEEWKKIRIFDMILLSKKEIPPNFKLP